MGAKGADTLSHVVIGARIFTSVPRGPGTGELEYDRTVMLHASFKVGLIGLHPSPF